MRFSSLSLLFLAAFAASAARTASAVTGENDVTTLEERSDRILKKGSKGSKSESKSKSEKGKKCKKLDPLPIKEDDFHEPHWEVIIEAAFPPWKVPENGCPRLDKVGGTMLPEYGPHPTAEAGKFNPCYYTKAFAGLDPSMGGYPTPIDTHYPYEFAAPFFGQPGDGSVKHCPQDSLPDIQIGSCPKLGQCEDVGDCATVSDEYGIGHVPPFVPLAAVKNAYNECSNKNLCSEWFDYESNGCNIKKDALDELILDQFGTEMNGETVVKYEPPILLDGKPSNTYFRLEYGKEEPACTDGECRGPHYCSKEVGVEDKAWGDFCPYVHTGENSGLYRHPHVALAALELWIANQCMPEKCPSTWLDSPNGQGYGMDDTKSTSITWCEMDNNLDPMAQPLFPYSWPNTGSGIYPGKELYGGKLIKPAPGMYVTEFVAL